MVVASDKGVPVPRYTEDQQKEVRGKILRAAEAMVVTNGWEACTSRRIGKALGQSRGLVNDYFKGTGLQEALVVVAYANLMGSVDRASAMRQSLNQVLTHVAREVAQDADVSSLMVQVTALFAAPGASSGDKLRAEISRVRANAARHISQDLERRGVYDRRDRLPAWSHALVAWFEAACALRVMTPAISGTDLRRLAYGFDDL